MIIWARAPHSAAALFLFVSCLVAGLQALHATHRARAGTWALSALSFKDLSSDKIPHWLLQTCEKLGFHEPTNVQQEALPSIFEGRDVVLQAQTGSGKTLAYGLPVLSSIDASRAAIQAVIVVPTRELGLQVSAVLKQLSTGSPERIMIMTVVEGSKNRRQQLWATAEPPHVVVGNPKALQRLVDLGRLRLNSVSFVVLDEVDAILISPETRQDLHKLLSQKLSNSYQSVELENLLDDEAAGGLQESLVYTNLAKDHRDITASQSQYRSSRQTIMCSATIPQRQHFASTCLKNGWTETLPLLVHVSAAELVPKQVKHEHIEVPAEQRLAVLRYVVAKELSAHLDQGGGGFRAIVFTDEDDQQLQQQQQQQQNTVDLELIKKACESGLKRDENKASGTVSILREDSSLDERASSLLAFREGAASILLCSGLAARGIDVPETSHVVMLDLPDNVNEYVHRAGRAGRMGRPGKVITLSAPGQDFVVARFSNELGVTIKKRSVRLTSKPSMVDTAVPEDAAPEKATQADPPAKKATSIFSLRRKRGEEKEK